MLRRRLKEIMKKKGVSSYEIEKKLGIDQSTLSRFFKREINLSLEKLEQILQYLDYEITLGEALGRDKKKHMKPVEIAELKIEGIIEEFETGNEVYVRDVSFGAGKVKVTYEEGTVGRRKIEKPPEEPYQKRPKPLKPKDWKK
jgi:transcriptional regulator with XRE-family HTH domain